MTGAPAKCVADTNVALIANRAHALAHQDCVAACADCLQAIMTDGHLYVDDGGLVVAEYRKKLNAKGEPGPGDMFLKWVLTHEWGGSRVTRVPITPKASDPTDFEELPPPPPGVSYDPSDRKFLAVACASSDKPAIVEALDSKWWGWKDALAAIGVAVQFLCPAEAAALYAKKLAK